MQKIFEAASHCYFHHGRWLERLKKKREDEPKDERLGLLLMRILPSLVQRPRLSRPIEHMGKGKPLLVNAHWIFTVILTDRVCVFKNYVESVEIDKL